MIELFIPNHFLGSGNSLSGSLKIQPRGHRIVIESIGITMAEHQYIGRGKARRHLQHIMGHQVIARNLIVKEEDSVDVLFTLSYNYVMSPAEIAASKHLKDRLIVWLLQVLKGVKSEFQCTAVVKIKNEKLPHTITKFLNKK